MKRKSQFSVVESILLLSLLAFTITFLYESKEPISTNPEYTIESFTNALYYNESLLINAVNEDLSSSTISENWSVVQSYLDSAFTSYGLTVKNNTISKKIYSCNSTYNRYVTQRPVTIADLNTFEFRIITLEICY